MDKTYTIRLQENDLGQALDGLCARAEAWHKTAEYLETGVAPDKFFVCEECGDADEAREIAEHYDRIINTIRQQREAQRRL
jgi:hypothetical protein